MFDKNGNMRQWWSNKTVEEYVNRTVCFINQYSSYYLPEADDHVRICIPIIRLNKINNWSSFRLMASAHWVKILPIMAV